MLLPCLGIGIEFKIALTDVGEMSFDKSFLHFNVKNIYMHKLL